MPNASLSQGKGLHVQCRFGHDSSSTKPFSRVEKVADERIVEPRLPLLYEGEFKAVVVSTTNKKNQKEGLGPKHRGSDVHARI